MNMSGGDPEGSNFREKHSDNDDYEYEVLTTEDIIKYMIDCINNISNVVEIPPTAIRILLNHFKWDKEKLLEALFEGDQEKLFSEVGIVNPFDQPHIPNNSPPSSKTSLTSKKSGTDECDLCYRICLTSFFTGLGCGHKFCLSCWRKYLYNKIMDESMGETIECAAPNCNVLVDDVTVMRLIKDPKVKLKYQQLIINSFVQRNRLFRWCPSPGCNYAIRVFYVDAKPVKCKCGHRFCFACGECWHEPVKCYLLKNWMKKCEEDSETSKWIDANTKECPECGATIEKDGGCNHMVCKNQNCKAEFCWVCLGPWEPHGSAWYECNRFHEEDSKAARDAQKKSRSSLLRYLFYFNRYMNTAQSLKFENKLYESVTKKMDEMQQHNMTWIEVQFLKKAVDVLCQCRQTLMYTYVFAYYLVKTNQSTLFEHNQRDLERATETLSEYLERDITTENLVDIKQKVQDKIRYCDSRRKVLLEHVFEGYDKDWWVYTEKF